MTNCFPWGKIEEMAEDDIAKALAEFHAKLKPIELGSVTEAGSIKSLETPPEAPSAVSALVGGEACINEEFKGLVGALAGRYVGVDIKDLVVTFLESLPVCPG